MPEAVGRGRWWLGATPRPDSEYAEVCYSVRYLKRLSLDSYGSPNLVSWGILAWLWFSIQKVKGQGHVTRKWMSASCAPVWVPVSLTRSLRTNSSSQRLACWSQHVWFSRLRFCRSNSLEFAVWISEQSSCCWARPVSTWSEKVLVCSAIAFLRQRVRDLITIIAIALTNSHSLTYFYLRYLLTYLLMFEEHMLLLYTYVVRTEHLRWFSRDFAGPCTACGSTGF